MGKHFDELSKSLASGESRRVTLKRFATGTVGGLLTSVLPGRGAQVAAQGGGGCKGRCHETDLEGRAYKRCVKRCKDCKNRGGHYVVMNASQVCLFQ